MLRKDVQSSMDRWINLARLSGGVDSEKDVKDGLESAAHVCKKLVVAGEVGEENPWRASGSAILSAFMVAAANTPTGSAEALMDGPDHSQVIFANLARNESSGALKAKLEICANMEPKIFNAAMSIFAI